MSKRVIPIPERAHPEVRLLLQKTRWTNAKISSYTSLLAVGIQERIQEATDRMWNYLASEISELQSIDEKLFLDSDTMRIFPLDGEGKPVEDRAIPIPAKYHPVVERLFRDIHVAQEARSCVPHTIMKIDAEMDVAYGEIMSILRRYIPEVNQGGIWGVDPQKMTVYETDTETLKREIAPDKEHEPPSSEE